MALRRRSVCINGHRTSISIEDEFWAELTQIAAARGQSAASLIAAVDRTRTESDPPPNLSSALRVFVLASLRREG